jgi:hypothetical protein
MRPQIWVLNRGRREVPFTGLTTFVGAQVVPEPTTAFLVIVGLAGLVLAARSEIT